MCVLLGYGADAICPYLVFESMVELQGEGIISESLTEDMIFRNYVEAMERGIAKVSTKEYSVFFVFHSNHLIKM